MPQPVGARLGPYEILSPLGAGGMGEVYRARDTRLNREIALKVLPGTFTNDPDRRSRFTREAQLLASLNHPNVAAVYGLEYDGDAPALAMELVPGSTLADRIAQGPILVDEAVRIARQLAEALDAAHRQGIIHRDLKPANIKVRPDGAVKVLDFGLAKLVEPETPGRDGRVDAAIESPTMTSPMTMRGVILGTAAYMSPEQARGRAVDKRADIWAFGAVLFEMLAGRRPFPGHEVSDTLAAVLRDEPDWSALPAVVPASIADLIRRCLDKEPNTRVADASVLRYVLDDSTHPASSTAVSLPRRWAALPVGIAALLAAAATTIAIALTSGFGNAEEPRPAPIRFTVPAPDGGELGTPAVNDGSVAVSPDGSMLTFTTTNVGQRRRLWIRSLGTLTSTRVAGGDGASWPFWSSDGRSIGFVAGGQLKAVDVATLHVRTICDLPAGENGLGGSWSSGDTIIFATGQVRGQIFRVSANGGVPTAVTTLDQKAGEWRHQFPSFLPDGRRFLFTAEGDRFQRRALYVGSIDGGRPALVTHINAGNAAYASGYLLLSGPNATLVAQPFNTETARLEGEPIIVADDFAHSSATALRSHFAVSSNGVLAYQPVSLRATRLMWVDRHGKDLSVLAAGATFVNPAVAPNGRFVAADRFDRRTGRSKIWVFDLDRGTASQLNPELPDDMVPIWSGDSGALVFGGALDDAWGLMRKPIDATSRGEELRRFSVTLTYPTFVSKDGNTILLKQRGGGGVFRTVVLPVAEGKERFIEDANQGVLSPDQTWLAYSTRNEVYVRSFLDGGQRQVVSSGGGILPRWTADGRELFYVNGQTLMSVSVTPGTTLKLGAPRPLFTRTDWSQGRPAPTPDGHDYDIAPDGQRILLNLVDPSEAPPPMTVILNWPSLLAR